MLTMILNIFPYNFCRDFVTYCSCKIPIFPKFSTPKLFLYFWMFFENYLCTYAFQHTYYSRNTISRWKRQKYMNMFFTYLQSIYVKIMISRYFFKNTLHPLPNISSQYPLSIFWGPYQMILGIIYYMTSSFQIHALSIAHFFLPLAEELFIPVYKTGHSSSDFRKKILHDTVGYITIKNPSAHPKGF